VTVVEYALNRHRVQKIRALNCRKLVLGTMGLRVGNIYYVVYVIHVELYGTAEVVKSNRGVFEIS
jgi:hypothetical protein